MILKMTFTRFITVNALLFSTAFLIVGQTVAHAQQQPSPLTPAQSQSLARDLIPFGSQDFFRRGKDLMEREIQILQQRQVDSNKPVLKINSIPEMNKKHDLTNS